MAQGGPCDAGVVAERPLGDAKHPKPSHLGQKAAQTEQCRFGGRWVSFYTHRMQHEVA